MNRTKLLLLSVLFLPWASGLLNAQAEKLQFLNPGFEQKTSDNKPSDWQSDSKGESQVMLDSRTVHEGSSSLLISNKDFCRTAVLSGQVRLKIGSLYRLSAWVKTENAYTNPVDQYPTPVAACVSMQSFPFTNHSPALGSTSDWQKIETIFIATTKEDRISLNLGYNGGAKGNAWFDDVQLEEVNDISEYIPMETVKWYGNAFRFEDKGWVFMHIEGEPYQRGYQYGYLAADEIKEFINKLAIKKNTANPQQGWNDIRFSADAIMLRRYEEEYLTEMKGIAEGVNKAGINIFGKSLDLIDIVALNSSIDLDYAADALHNTSNPLTGKSFLAAEDELSLQDKLHKCSSFLATKSASKDNRIVFGQLFMWNGYTGPHWNFIVDVKPSKGNRLVYETYPGGIHSGADFYINEAGIMIGETTVGQTPYNPDGMPQSNRIRKAAQYANSIDDVVNIMTTKNNGLYTNDWLIADTKTDEIAILILGTNKYKVWRSSKNDFYNGQKDWYWSDNNNKSLDVRKEYIVNDDNAPYDLAFRPVNRDLAFTKFYEENHGKIDANAAFNLWNSSPINRPHACDGKVTTSEMAEHMMFFANYGKVTLREMFVNENGRVPDLPGAIPHLSLGYSVINPVLFTEKLTELHRKDQQKAAKTIELSPALDNVKEAYSFDKASLWHNTVYPSSEKVNWFISGTAAYWNMLNSMPPVSVKAANFVRDELAELNSRLLYTMQREGTVAPDQAATAYNEYKQYQIPRIRGTYLLHQLRLLLGNGMFSRAMTKFHETYKEKEITSKDFVNTLESLSGKKLDAFVSQWISRDDLPQLNITAASNADGDGWMLTLNVKQNGKPYNFLSTVMIETGREQVWKKVEVTDAENTFSFRLKDKPEKLTFNEGNDIPVERNYIYTFSNFTDDFSKTLIVYGTSGEDEANHTLAQRFQKMAADKFTEILIPIKKDNEVDAQDLSQNDLVILGSASENGLTQKVIEKLGLKAGKNVFNWNGKVYGSSDDGLFAAYPNPYNPKKTVYLFVGNSALELYHMTKNLYRMPQWAIFKKDQIVEKGYHVPSSMQVILTGNAAQ